MIDTDRLVEAFRKVKLALIAADAQSRKFEEYRSDKESDILYWEKARAALKVIAEAWPGEYREPVAGYTLFHETRAAILAALEEK